MLPQHRPVAVGVLGVDGLGLRRSGPARRRTGRRADSRGSPPACPAAGWRRAAAAGSCRPGTRSTAMSSCGSKTIASASSPGGLPPICTVGVGLAGDDVGVGHHQVRAPRPSRCPRSPGRRPSPAPAPRCAGAALTPGAREDSARRRRHVGRRPADRGQRVEPGQRVEDRPGRRQQLVELPRGWPSAGCRASDCELVDWSAIAPTIQAIPSPTQAVSTAPSSPSTVRSPGNRSAARARAAETLEPAGQHAARQQRPEQAEQRRVLGVRAARQDQRREPGPEERADPEPEQRQARRR